MTDSPVHSPAPRAPTSTRRSERGTTFAELMLAVLVISTTVVASHSSLTGTVSAYHYFADGAHESLLLAKEVHEAAVLLPWEDGDGGAEHFGSAETLSDLDGMTFSPPRSAGYEIVTSHIGWSQSVEVKTVSMDDPTLEVDPDEFEGQTLTELTVSVMDGDSPVGTYSWWVTEPTND